MRPITARSDLRMIPPLPSYNAAMPIFEVTISGAITTRDEDDELVCFEEQYTFVKQARDLITAMMAVQQKLDVLNEAIKEKRDAAKVLVC